MAMRELPLETGFRGAAEDATPAVVLGRDCVRFAESAPVLVTALETELLDGTIEMDLAVSGERSFPGLAWRVNGTTYESFFIRPHQVGNPDSVQYTPVFNAMSGWQLYTGRGHWAPVSFPLDQWFTLRVSFAGERGEAYVGDLDEPALVFSALKAPLTAGAIGILPGGSGVHIARFAYDRATPTLRGRPLPTEEIVPGTIPGWWVSALLAEGSPPDMGRDWSYHEAEASGLLNLSRVHPVGNRLNTVFARTTIQAAAAGTRTLQLGFSDRALVYLGGQPLFAANDTYRSRDYRFLGSIGYWYRLHLPLIAGDNELVIAVSEDFGGWGVMGRFTDGTGLTFG